MTRQTYCHICGGPFLGDDHSWLGEAILLSTGHRTQDAIEIDDYCPFGLDQNGYHLSEHESEEADRVLLRFDSVYDCDKGTFCLSEWNETVKPSVPDTLSGHFRSSTLFVPVHKACLQLADHFILTASISASAATGTTRDRITSELQLCEVLCRRLDQLRDIMANEPHNFFLPSDCQSCMPWEQEYDPGEFSFLDPSVRAITYSTLIDLC